MHNKYLIVVAGGHGTRMGAAVPKQFIELEGKAILHRTIEKFVSAVPDVKVVTVLPKEFIQDWKDYCIRRNFGIRQTIVEGGVTRYHSVKNALEKVGDGDIVAIHDGVRPLLSESLIRTMFKKMEDLDALVPVLPSVDTLRVLCADGEGNLRTKEGARAERSEIFAVQTPQMFRSEKIKAAYRQPYEVSFTDDASVAERKGITLSFTEGERFNIKITTPSDLEFARMILGSSR